MPVRAAQQALTAAAGPARLAATVVGVGGLFLPGLASGMFGPAALMGWLYHLAAGLMLVIALGAVARGAVDRGVGAPAGGVAHVARAALGRPAGDAVRWYYAIGVTAGQAVVATVGAALLARAAGSTRVPLAVALAIVAVATGVSATGWRAPAWTSALTFVAVVACVAASVQAIAAGDAAPHAGGLGRAAFMMVFAFVGWESVLRWTRPSAPALVSGVAVIAIVLLGAAMLARHPAPPPWRPADHAFALLGGAVCALACLRNVGAVTDIVSGGAPRNRAASVACTAACGASAAGGVMAIDRGVFDLVDVLAVPNVMGLAVFLTAAGSAAVLGRRRSRPASVLAVLAYAALVPFAGVAVFIPLGVLLTCVLAAALGRGHATDQSRLVRRVPGDDQRPG